MYSKKTWISFTGLLRIAKIDLYADKVLGLGFRENIQCWGGWGGIGPLCLAGRAIHDASLLP